MMENFNRTQYAKTMIGLRQQLINMFESEMVNLADEDEFNKASLLKKKIEELKDEIKKITNNI